MQHPYATVSQRILELCERRKVVVGEAEKAIKELSLTSRNKNLVELCRDVTVQQVLVDLASEKHHDKIKNYVVPLSIKFVV